jgi:hypothetical protein
METRVSPDVFYYMNMLAESFSVATNSPTDIKKII